MQRNFHGVKRMYVEQQDDGRESGSQEAEFQQKVRKECAYVGHGGNFVTFRFSVLLAFKTNGPTRTNQSSDMSKIDKQQMADTHWAHWHSYSCATGGCKDVLNIRISARWSELVQKKKSEACIPSRVRCLFRTLRMVFWLFERSWIIVHCALTEAESLLKLQQCLNT